MKASRAIELLQGYKPDEEIYIMWWDSEIAIDFSGEVLTDDEWYGIVSYMEHHSVGSEDVSDYLISDIERTVGNRKKVK